MPSIKEDLSGMRQTEGSATPQARTQDLLVERIDDELVVYDLYDKQVHCLGPLATSIFELCDGQRSSSELALAASAGTGRTVTGEEVAAALAELDEHGLLVRPTLAVHNGLSRRDMMRKSARLGAAVAAVPLITSVVAPTAAMALNGIPTGCTGCGQNKDCASNHCCQAVPGKQCLQTCCVGANNSCQLDSNNNCTVQLAGCGDVICPPGTGKCCT